MTAECGKKRRGVAEKRGARPGLSRASPLATLPHSMHLQGATPSPTSMPETRPRDGRLVVVANRLPVSKSQEPDGEGWKTSPGGLVSALAPILRAADGAWVGWSGTAGEVPKPFHHDGLHLHPVGLDESELETFYTRYADYRRGYLSSSGTSGSGPAPSAR